MQAHLHEEPPFTPTGSGLRVSDLMSRTVFTVVPEATVEVARNLMRLRRVRHLPVVDARGAVCGVVSHRDLLRHGAAEEPGPEPRDTPVSQVMTAPVLTIAPEEPVAAAAHVMLNRKLGCLPVLDRGALVGIVTEADFVRYLADR
jgi:CBS domain-containing protein